MKQALCSMVLLSLSLLSACGGGGSGSGTSDSSSASTSSSYNFSTSSSNVVALSVNPGPQQSDKQTFNIPQVTVTVCSPNMTKCAAIPNVLVDTGSSGLRLMASVLSAAGVTLPAMPDPSNDTATIAECLPFADGYAWGTVTMAKVTVGGETTASAIPVQVIDDNDTTPSVSMTDCANNGTSLDSVNAFDANGVIGVSTFNQDCGSSCVGASNADLASFPAVYWTCSSVSCSPSNDLTLADQVANPVASFPTDNNGVIVQLQSIPSIGATTASGYLVFGIGTESNNTLGSATVLTANEEGNFTTEFDGQSLPGSFIDSGSNALYFNDSTLENDACKGSAGAQEFYCPSSTQSLTATNQGGNGTTSDVSFPVANLGDINNSYFAIDDVAGIAPSIGYGYPAYFDWGLPFFYGRTVFVAIEGAIAGGAEGPFYAY